MIADIVQLNDIRQKEVETVKTYFKMFSNVINKIKIVTDEKVLDALVTGLYMRTPFWKDVQNSQPKTYSQLVNLVQRKIRSEETIENREKAERERGDRYRRRGDTHLNPVLAGSRRNTPQGHGTTTTEGSTKRRWFLPPS
ncbi:Retrotrans gag domain-containing protein [Abeliophyllum distichum]|uniref:Retrotrans gag domain-containing protein n=1 Tax=Abeliophyllum distichum TaxID=126358 RepID=A0ABD1V5S4_9LAMI